MAESSTEFTLFTAARVLNGRGGPPLEHAALPPVGFEPFRLFRADQGDHAT